MKDPNVMARNVMGAYGEGLDKSFCWRDFKGFLQLMVDAAWLAWQFFLLEELQGLPIIKG